MSAKFSTALAKAIAGDQPWDAVLRGGKFLLFDGAIGATAETAVPSTQYVMPITRDSGVWTAMQGAANTITVTACSIGQTLIVAVAGIQIHSTHTCTTAVTDTEAAALVLAINNSSPFNMGIRATVVGSVITLHAPFGTGTLFDGVLITETGTASVTIGGAFAAGVDGANLVDWSRDATLLNKLVKPASDAWGGECPVTVTSARTLTFFRYILDDGDDGFSDDTVNKAFRRWQGTIGGSTSSSADLKLPLVSPSVVSGVTLSVSSFDFTIPLS